MMVGRFVGAGILTKFKPRVLLSSCVSLGALCILLSLFFADSMFGIWLMLAAGLFHSVMWPLIFNLGLMHLGRHTKAASGIINTGVIGAAVLMPIMGAVVDFTGVIIAMCVMFVYYAYIFWFCNWGSNIGLSDRK
jgi:FHS family L-fucose permease-like MFS transporter